MSGMQEKRVSTDGYAYTRSEFLEHFGGTHEWNTAPVETRYDRDGNTYTQAAFYAHYGRLDEWNAARHANANPRVVRSTSTLPAVQHVAPGWSSDRGPTAPDEGFFDTQGYQEQFHSYDDMAYSPQVYGHWSASSSSSVDVSAQYDIRAGNLSSRSEASQNSYHDAHPAPTLSQSTAVAPTKHTNREPRPGTSACVTRSRDAPLRGRHPMYRKGNTRHHAGLGGGRYAAGAQPSASSFRSSQGGAGARTNLHQHTPQMSRQPTGYNNIERSLSSLGRKLFAHIPPTKKKHFFPPDSPKSTPHAGKGIHRRKSAGEQLGALTPKNGRSPDRPGQRSSSSSSDDVIEINDYISVRCNVSGRFRLCRVLDLRDGEPPTVHVHFEGTPEVPDELIRFDSNRLAPFGAQQSPSHGENSSADKKIVVANSKKVSIGDFAEVRIFYQDPSTKKGDFRWQMAQIVSLDSNDGSIRVHFEGLSDTNIGDEIIPGADVHLRVRAMSTGIPSPVNSPKRHNKLNGGGKLPGLQDKKESDENGLDTSKKEGNELKRSAHSGTNNQIESDADERSSSDESSDGASDGSKESSNLENMRESKSDIAKELRKQGLRVIKIAADGNCLFRAVCHQVYADVSRHLELRQCCCDYMASHVDHFSAFVEGKFDDYLKSMRDATTWGGNLEIEALQEMFDRKIQIHSNDDRGGHEAKAILGSVDQAKQPELAQKKLGTDTSKSAPSLLPKIESGGNKSASSSVLIKGRSSSSMAALDTLDSTKPNPNKVPSIKVPVVLKHDFSSSKDSATPRPASERVPEPIMLSYHGRSHYNSVVNPKHPPPLQPLETSYIRQGRILRAQQTQMKAAEGNGSLTKSHSEGSKGQAPPKEKASTSDKKAKKKANRLAFFRFRKKKMEESGDDDGSGGTGSAESLSDGEKRIKKPTLKPIQSEPLLHKSASESAYATGDIRNGSRNSVLHARQERQRPSLPSIQCSGGSDATSGNGSNA
eukprot:g3235.t1